jgi:hypothetical protein
MIIASRRTPAITTSAKSIAEPPAGSLSHAGVSALILAATAS